ncbi:glutamic acid-rich protein-like [Papaver somniferum]|uniref:glutamic acid-rich protein-like n=1 Tax=Papaver somniferum TaxID=3469 RepID=UPI000E6FCB59|nr:glutamic acid-rich protein-like [Papaver somniferum]
MSVRDPQLLLPRLIRACANHEIVVPEVAVEESRKSPATKTKEASTSVKRAKDTNKPYRSGFHAINEFVNKYLEEDGEVRKKDCEKFWFTYFQLEKQKESPFWPILDVFVYKKAEKKEEEKSEKKKQKKRDVWFKNPDSILKVVNQFRHDNSGENVFVFNTAEEKQYVEVESMPEDLVLIFGLPMVESEPVEGESTKTQAEMRYGSLITRMKLKDPTKLGKLDVENEILRIMKLKPKLDREIERNAEDLYWFSEHNNSMTPSNEQGFSRFLRWVISDISNTIEKAINESMKKKNRQQNSTDALKRKLYIALQQRDEALEELSDLQVKHEKLVSFIEEKIKKIHAADPRNVENDKDLVDLFVDTLQEIISFNKELKREDERDDDDQEEEEGEKGNDDEKCEKCGDIHDDSDDDDEEEEGGDEEDRTESEKNKVPSETPKKPSTSMPQKNEDQQDQMDLDNQDVRNTTQTYEIDEAAIIASQAISQLDPKCMLPVEEDVFFLTQGEETENGTYTSI